MFPPRPLLFRAIVFTAIVFPFGPGSVLGMDRGWLLLLVCISSGCGLMRAATPTRNLAPVENPLFVAVEDREYFWNQLVDAIDDHFQIVQEDRVQAIGGILT